MTYQPRHQARDEQGRPVRAKQHGHIGRHRRADRAFWSAS